MDIMFYLKFIILFLGACSCLDVHSSPYSRRFKNTKECKTLKIPNGRVRTRARSIFAQFVCNRGFTLAGERFVKCIKGEWSGKPPICVNNKCKKVTQPRNGFVLETLSGGVLNFFCLPGYMLHGFRRVFCDGSSWSGHLPSCLASNSTPSLSCDFESEDLCGWTHDLNHDFDWTRRSFKDKSNTSSIQTGPRYDHTLGPDGQGHYMHIEASSGQINDTSRLISPVYSLTTNKTFHLSRVPEDPESGPELPPSDSLILLTTNRQNLSLTPLVNDALDPTSKKSICLKLFFHMSGMAGQQLRVYITPTSGKWDLRPEKAVFWAQGNYGEGWHKIELMLEEIIDPFQIIIEGVGGDSFQSDIAVDDVSIIVDCDYTKETNDSEKLTTVVETIQIESCLNRCYGDKSVNETDSFLIACDCDENCVLNSTCCPDFTALCILGNTEDFATDISTTEQIQIATDVLKTTQMDIPKHSEDNDMDNNIDAIFVLATTMKSTTTTATTKKSTTSTTTKTAPIQVVPTKSITNVILTTTVKPIVRKPITTVIVNTSTTLKPIVIKKITPVTVKTLKTTTTSTTTQKIIKQQKTTEPDYSLLSERLDILISPRNDIDIFNPEPPIPPNELSKFAKITVANPTKKSSSLVPQYLVIVGVVCFALVGVVATAALFKKYAVRRCRYFGRGTGAHGDSQSDVRFLTSDEILDFTLQRPSEEYNHTI